MSTKRTSISAVHRCSPPLDRNPTLMAISCVAFPRRRLHSQRVPTLVHGWTIGDTHQFVYVLHWLTTMPRDYLGRRFPAIGRVLQKTRRTTHLLQQPNRLTWPRELLTVDRSNLVRFVRWFCVYPTMLCRSWLSHFQYRPHFNTTRGCRGTFRGPLQSNVKIGNFNQEHSS